MVECQPNRCEGHSEYLGLLRSYVRQFQRRKLSLIFVSLDAVEEKFSQHMLQFYDERHFVIDTVPHAFGRTTYL